jgi:hypothetical protein
MKKNNLLIPLISLLAFSLGTLFGCVFTSWCRIKDSFFDIRLLEIIQLSITILIAIIVSYFISGKIGRDLKKRETINDLISKIQGSLNEVLSCGYEYIGKPERAIGRKIIIIFKNLSMLMSIISEIRKLDSKTLNYDETLHMEFVKFKEAITDTPFGQKNASYSSDRIDKIQDKFNLLSKMLFDCKIRLFS